MASLAAVAPAAAVLGSGVEGNVARSCRLPYNQLHAVGGFALSFTQSQSAYLLEREGRSCTFSTILSSKRHEQREGFTIDVSGERAVAAYLCCHTGEAAPTNKR